MKEKEFEKSIKDMKEKLGEENSGLILDDLGLLITDNSAMNKTLKEKEAQIEQLKKDKENLLNVNANLFQQVSIGEEEDETKKKEEQKPVPFDFRSAFDEKGNFKK